MATSLLEAVGEQRTSGEWLAREREMAPPEVATPVGRRYPVTLEPASPSLVAPPMLFTVDERVRWSAVDKAGIIFYGAYVRFFELAEMELFRSAGVPYSDVFDQWDMWLPRAHLESDFHYPSRLDDKLRVGAYFTRFGTSSLQINFDILHLGARRLAVSGHEVLVCTTRDTLKPRPLPPDLVEILRPYCMTVEDARAELGL